MDENDEEEDNVDDDVPTRAPAYYKGKSLKVEGSLRVNSVPEVLEAGGGGDKKDGDDVGENIKASYEMGTSEESDKKTISAFFQAISIPPG